MWRIAVSSGVPRRQLLRLFQHAGDQRMPASACACRCPSGVLVGQPGTSVKHRAPSGYVSVVSCDRRMYNVCHSLVFCGTHCPALGIALRTGPDVGLTSALPLVVQFQCAGHSEQALLVLKLVSLLGVATLPVCRHAVGGEGSSAADLTVAVVGALGFTLSALAVWQWRPWRLARPPRAHQPGWLSATWLLTAGEFGTFPSGLPTLLNGTYSPTGA